MADNDHNTPRGWRRWLMSTNHKDIGTMYIILSIIAGLIGGAFSVLFSPNYRPCFDYGVFYDYACFIWRFW